MGTRQLSVTFNPEASITEPIEQGLHAYNLARLGSEVTNNYHYFAVTMRDEAGTVLGGLVAEMYWDWLYIKTLWVAETRRGETIGSQLLARAEQLAVERGFVHSHLETTNFQALAFYQKQGYEIFGVLDGKPAGSTWYYLKKHLRPDASAPTAAAPLDKEAHESNDSM